MSGKQRLYKQRIHATETLAKVFRAMELIAASRIGKARDAATQSTPFDHALSHAMAAVSMHSNFDHPVTRERTDTNRVAVLAITSDRGLAGAYSATILRETDNLLKRLREAGKTPILYTFGRKAQSYYRFRGAEVRKEWTGNSDAPDEKTAEDIADTLLGSFLAASAEDGVAEVYLIFTRYVNMVSQVPTVRRMLPMKVQTPEEADDLQIEVDWEQKVDYHKIDPLYEFEPNPQAVLNQLLPMYVRSRIRAALLQAAASELASRQTAMHTANDNAQDLIERYTRLANNARQAEITTEITEIVGGAEALAAGK